MPRIVAAAVLGLGACAPETSEPWRECDDAFAALSAPRAPLDHASIVPVEIGDTLPTLRITGRPTDADALANRALASACVLTDGDVSATPALSTWAEAAQGGELFPDVGEVFDPPMDLYSWPSDTVALDLEVTRDSNAARPELRPGEIDDGVGLTMAQAIAESTLTQLVERGMIADTELRLVHASQWQTSQCAEDGDVCSAYVERFSYVFVSHFAGAMAVGSWALLDVDRDGVLVGLRLSTVDIESAGTTIAAIDEAGAEQRFLELAQAQFPMLEVRIHTTGQVAYVVPRVDEPAEAEAVWYGLWITASDSGVSGSPQPSSLALSDANAPLVPLGP